VNLGNSIGADTTALLLIGFQAIDQPTIYDGHLLVVPANVFLLQVPGVGLGLSGALPCDDSLCGLAICLQALEIDTGASRGVSFTPGLLLVLGL
jgi:hypothetical protein